MTPDAPQTLPQAQVCDRCHRRKTRCGKIEPACGPCRKAETPCVYSERAKETVYSRAFVERLQRRVDQLEANARTLLEATARHGEAASLRHLRHCPTKVSRPVLLPMGSLPLMMSPMSSPFYQRAPAAIGNFLAQPAAFFSRVW